MNPTSVPTPQPAEADHSYSMRSSVLFTIIFLVAFLTLTLSALLIQWLLMKREQRRIEDLVELRARQSGSAAGGRFYVEAESEEAGGSRGGGGPAAGGVKGKGSADEARL
jgi:uncharacterized membrane protein YgcG